MYMQHIKEMEVKYWSKEVLIFLDIELFKIWKHVAAVFYLAACLVVEGQGWWKVSK